MCCICVGYKKCDLKIIEVWQAEQNKRQRIFAFSAKNWVLFCVGFCVVIGFYSASL
jgi:hypothetical protein